MIEPYIRPLYQKTLVDPIARVTAGWLTPNVVTGLAAVSGLLILPAMIFNEPYWALLFLLLSGFCDTLDGTLARLGHRASDAGAVLDIISDRLVEFSVLLALLLVDPFTRAVPCLFMLGSILLCVTSFLVVGIFSENQSSKGFHYSPGLIERPEAFAFFVAMILLPNYFGLLAVLFTGLVTLTTVVRVYEFIKKN